MKKSLEYTLFGHLDSMTVAKLREMVRKDIEKPVEQWTEQDKQDWRDMGWRLPKHSKKEKAK
jgi:hypothetical protein